jgi:acyl carrier protein
MEARRDILERLKPLVERVISVPGGNLSPDEPLLERGLDSVGMVDLLASVEERFEVTIPPVDISPENFATTRALATLLARLTDRC